MDITTVTFLKELDVSKVGCCLKVRIIKLWKTPSYKIPNGYHAFELYLMDEEGNRIQATVNHMYLRKVQKLLVEKACLFISKPVIGDNDSKNPLLNHPHRLFFNGETTVAKCNDPVGSLHGFDFKSFDILQNYGIADESTIDIIGSNNLFVTLWASFAEKMDTCLANKEEGVPTIMILQFGKYSYTKGKAYVYTNFLGSTLYINDEIDSFKKSLIESESNDSSSSRRLMASQLVTRVEDDFLTHTVFNSIAEVNRTVEIKSVIVMGTIITFLPSIEWYYPACKTCNKRVASDLVEENLILVCPNIDCNKKPIYFVPRFKIPLRVQDSTGVVSLTLWDRDAKKLFTKSAKEFVDMIIEGDSLERKPDEINDANAAMIPTGIQDLVGRKFAFKIDITSFNVSKNNKTFTVKKFTDDPTIISKLEANLETEQVQISESSLIKSHSFGSQDTINFKDAISSSADNATPLSLLESTTKTSIVDDKMKKKITHVDLKRNLVDLYDDDDLEFQSATKPRKNGIEGPNDVHNPTLLIPKREK